MKFSDSISTKYVKTPRLLSPSKKYISKNTTLFLLACKTKSWNIVKALLQLDPDRYPTLLKSVGQMKKHPLYIQDDSGANCLHLAIEDKQFDIARKIINIVDVYSLKNMIIVQDQTLLQYLEDVLQKDKSKELQALKALVQEEICKKKLKKAFIRI